MGGLREYLLSVESDPFRWADHNCMTFTSGALRACGFDGLPHDWCHGGNTAMAATRAYKRRLARSGFDGIIDAMDDRYERVQTLHPSDGMICARPSNRALRYSFGITFGRMCFHVGDYGLIQSDPQIDDLFWRAG